MIISVHQPQYVPWLGYFDKIYKSDIFVYLDDVQYKHREFQNRNKIRTKDGPLWLTVPVIYSGQGRQPICDVVIDNSSRWNEKHLKSLEAWYAHAPYFKEHHNFFTELYEKNWEKLGEFNIHIIEYMLKQFGVNKQILFESQLGITTQKTDRIVDICRKLKADAYLSGSGGRDYLEEAKFTEAGIKLVYQEFKHPVYKQQFCSGEADFMPFMSGIDLLFNEGPNSCKILGTA